MTVDNQWMDGGKYNIPISKANNTNEITNINLIALDYNNLFSEWINDEYLVDNYGSLKEFEFEDTQTYDSNQYSGYSSNSTYSSDNSSRNFQKVLLNNRLHYNTFYIPSKLSTNNYYNIQPTIYSMFNASAFHSIPLTFNALNSWILKYKLKDINLVSEPEIKLFSWPLPTTTTEKQFSGAFGGLWVTLFLMIALVFLPIGAIGIAFIYLMFILVFTFIMCV